ncbi:MAG: Periplasmic component of the Tol biopolymer transport system-like protein [Bryobacterales bacterium]|nr:Periplasmic component of the Tol biopolymer transport system-like protein [Bryobacterales bacterium]
MKTKTFLRIAAFSCLAVVGYAQTPGVFESSGDVGVTPQKGKVEFNSSSGEYSVTGGGANIWADADAFYFVWKKISGDVALTADVHFIGTGVVAHRKAALMIRQSLDANSAYADIALHGDGLTSLQFRPSAAAMTQEVRSDLKAPVRIRIERRGQTFTAYAGAPGEELKPAGPATVALQDPVYVGLAIGSHDANVLETAVFSNVKVEPLAAQTRPRYASKISIYDLRDKSVRVVYKTNETFEAPNWSADGKYLLSNSRGRLFRIPLDGSPEPVAIDLDPTLRCNNDHGFSPDGKQIAFSASSPSSRQSQVYIASVNGSAPKMMVSATPSYFHGWSPDGKYLAVIAQREGNFDIFRVPAGGGPEQRLTSSPGYDDGADYSPDGKWIYFNSDRSGSWDIWRIPPDGAGTGDSKAQQVTADELEDWFPHPSPDGKHLVFLSFPKGTSGHNDKLDVELRMVPMPGATGKSAAPQTLLKFFGGQGTINVNSWSPDSTRFAFVVYETLPSGASQ